MAARSGNQRSANMTSTSANVILSRVLPILSTLLGVLLCTSVLSVAQQSATKKTPAATVAPFTSIMTFDTPQEATDALVEAADKFDVVALSHIFSPGGEAVVFSGEFAQDRKHAADFAAEAREKKTVSVDP